MTLLLVRVWVTRLVLELLTPKPVGDQKRSSTPLSTIMELAVVVVSALVTGCAVEVAVPLTPSTLD
jgi:hypothetical protein